MDKTSLNKEVNLLLSKAKITLRQRKTAKIRRKTRKKRRRMTPKLRRKLNLKVMSWEPQVSSTLLKMKPLW